MISSHTSSSETDKILSPFLLGTNNVCNGRNVMLININITKATNLWHCEISVNLQRRKTVVRLSTKQSHKWSSAVNENDNTDLALWGQSQSTMWQWPASASAGQRPWPSAKRGTGSYKRRETVLRPVLTCHCSNKTRQINSSTKGKF